MPPLNLLNNMEKTFQDYQKFIAPLKGEKFDLTEKELKLTQAADIKFDYFNEQTGYENCDGDSALLCFSL